MSSNLRGPPACGRMVTRTTPISTSAAVVQKPASHIAPSTRPSPMSARKTRTAAYRRAVVRRRIARSRPSRVSGNIRSSAIRADHSDAGGAGPIFLRHRVEPHRLRIGVEQAAQPGFARLVVPALDAAALLFDLVRAHAGVADQHDFVAAVVGADQLHDRRSARPGAAANRATPYRKGSCGSRSGPGA